MNNNHSSVFGCLRRVLWAVGYETIKWGRQSLSLISGYSNIIVNANREVELPLLFYGAFRNTWRIFLEYSFGKERKVHHIEECPSTSNVETDTGTGNFAHGFSDRGSCLFIRTHMMITPSAQKSLLVDCRINKDCSLLHSVTTAFDTSYFPFFHIEGLPLNHMSRIYSWKEKSQGRWQECQVCRQPCFWVMLRWSFRNTKINKWRGIFIG